MSKLGISCIERSTSFFLFAIIINIIFMCTYYIISIDFKCFRVEKHGSVWISNKEQENDCVCNLKIGESKNVYVFSNRTIFNICKKPICLIFESEEEEEKNDVRYKIDYIFKQVDNFENEVSYIVEFICIFILNIFQIYVLFFYFEKDSNSNEIIHLKLSYYLSFVIIFFYSITTDYLSYFSYLIQIEISMTLITLLLFKKEPTK